MDFELSADQQMLQETVRRFFVERAGMPWVRSMLDSWRADDVWRGLAELGVLGVLVPEELGGTGLAMVDAGVVLEEAGRACFPGPLESSAVGAVSAVLLAGSEEDRERWLPGLADGSVVGTVWLGEPSPRLARVPDGMAADVLFIPGAEGLAAIPLEDADRMACESVDGTRPSADIEVPGPPPPAGGAAAEAVRDRMLVAGAVDGLGAASRALEMAVAYAGDRQQFGRPVGSFQAVQHLCADMLTDVEIGRAACYYALWACDSADARERRRAALMAQAWASDAFFRVGAACIQIHGGIGFTWEHDAHIPYKRLLTLQQRMGGATAQLAALADLVFG